MAKVPITEITSKSQWESIVAQYGNGALGVPVAYASLKAEDWPGHEVVRGFYIPSGSTTPQKTMTGFLRSGSNYKKSVSQLDG